MAERNDTIELKSLILKLLSSISWLAKLSIEVTILEKLGTKCEIWKYFDLHAIFFIPTFSVYVTSLLR